MFASGEAAIHQVLVKTRHGGNDYDDLRDVGGDEFLLVGVRAIEQRCARQDGVDYAAVVTAVLDLHAVTAGGVAAFAACGAFHEAAVRQLDAVAATERGGDPPLDQQGLRAKLNAGHKSNSASSLAAHIKSFSDKPLIACVTYDTRHWL